MHFSGDTILSNAALAFGMNRNTFFLLLFVQNGFGERLVLKNVHVDEKRCQWFWTAFLCEIENINPPNTGLDVQTKTVGYSLLAWQSKNGVCALLQVFVMINSIFVTGCVWGITHH